ncbi:Piso0_000112 [Millerozyma farinosa CBS 7064]|uniref:Piso0_000112 protein n=1 Tax=Pichia sorbitophila (strain ATCC MYA-4447 / BCRC 22081 / CBS 7064 / NBRC 10061 / NRRL Y-12695) TaxID=559304 RepID=G8YUJ7_PICSO|nr:Piso0_000112 [Millerozyma farinosa CBS 7064]
MSSFGRHLIVLHTEPVRSKSRRSLWLDISSPKIAEHPESRHGTIRAMVSLQWRGPAAPSLALGSARCRCSGSCHGSWCC